MFPYILDRIVLVRGYEAYGIYDLNLGQFHRVNIEAGEALEALNGLKDQKMFDKKTQSFFIQAKKLGIIEFQNSAALKQRTKLSEVIKKIRPVKFAWVELTSKCNQKCAHCFLGQDLNHYQHVDKEVIIQNIDILDSIGVRQIIFSGGEPTLHPHFSEILDHAASKKFRISLLSNASYSKFGNYIQSLKNYGVTVKVPLLGWQESHEKMTGVIGSFNITKNNIEALLNANVRLELGTTVTAINAIDIPKIRNFANFHKIPLEVSPVYAVGYAKQNSIDILSLNQKEIIEICRKDKDSVIGNDLQYTPINRPQYEFDSSDYEAVNLKDYLTEHFECGQKIIAILSSGEVTPCLMLRNKEHSLGSIYDLNLKEILERKSKSAQYFDEQMSLKGIPGCSGCEARFVCKAGGCPASTFAIKNTIKAKNPMFDRCYYQNKN